MHGAWIVSLSWHTVHFHLNDNQGIDIGVKVESISLAPDPIFYSFKRLQCKVIQATKGFPNNEDCHVSLLPLSTVENISPILMLYLATIRMFLYSSCLV